MNDILISLGCVAALLVVGGMAYGEAAPLPSDFTAIGKPSVDSGYSYDFWRVTYENYCPCCGKTGVLTWYYGWSPTSGGTYPFTGNYETGSLEGQIFCTNCDCDFDIPTGWAHDSKPYQLIAKTVPEPSTEQEAIDLCNSFLHIWER